MYKKIHYILHILYILFIKYFILFDDIYEYFKKDKYLKL